MYLHRANAALIGTIVFAFLGFLVFYVGDLGRDNSSLPIKIHIMHPVEIEKLNMVDDKKTPPPPPPPPPERLIKEDAKIIAPRRNDDD